MVIASDGRLTYRQILRIWGPLALSWAVMTAELPLFSTVLARMADAEINLAAWGIIFSLSIIVQAPSSTILAASTALSADYRSYRRLRWFTLAIGGGLSLLHALIAFTPLYDVVVGGWMAAPPEVLEPARVGLMIMTPWSLGTAYRRFEQGMLIRFRHPAAVTLSAVLRLSTDIVALMIGLRIGGVGGAALAASAITLGVILETSFTVWFARTVVRQELKPVREQERLTLGAFLRFYVPLAVTVLLGLIVQPLVSAAIGRMPGALQALAVWPVVFGLVTMWQSVGMAYNEVVIALLERPGGVAALRRFTMRITVIVSALFVFTLLSPVTALWLEHGAALSGELLVIAKNGLWLGALLPGLRILQSWYQGLLTYRRRTNLVTESVIVFIVVSGALLWLGTSWRDISGLYVGLGAMGAGMLAQTLWLWWRSRSVVAELALEGPRAALGERAYAPVRISIEQTRRRP